jgi:hypothetical protein
MKIPQVPRKVLQKNYEKSRLQKNKAAKNQGCEKQKVG